jgi:hypothetical protein
MGQQYPANELEGVTEEVKFSYLAIYYNLSSNTGEFAYRDPNSPVTLPQFVNLAQLGAEGWELAFATPITRPNGPGPFLYMLFKKEQ